MLRKPAAPSAAPLRPRTAAFGNNAAQQALSDSPAGILQPLWVVRGLGQVEAHAIGSSEKQ
jgi:hypothetical protein